MIVVPDDAEAGSFDHSALDPAGRAPKGTATGPTVLRIGLGGELRRRREAAGVTRERAGEAIRASPAKISRLELGRVGFKERDVADLLTLYGVADAAERAAVPRPGPAGQRARLVAPLLRPAARAGSRPTSGSSRPRR